MRRIVYHVATTLDGFIARDDGSIDGFLPEGDHVDDYLGHLQEYDTVIMGRRTYEFGYRFGLEPGKRAYPHMEHHVVSTSLVFDGPSEVNVVRKGVWERFSQIREQPGTDIYLCGGGALAGQMLGRGLIDALVLKQNPIVFGAGIRLFGDEPVTGHFKLRRTKQYETGVILLEYDRVASI